MHIKQTNETAVDLFGNPLKKNGTKRVCIYADEVQEVVDVMTGEKWIYTAAIYELLDMPILGDLIEIRYRKNQDDWQAYRKQNDTEIHWSDIGNDNNKKNVVNRWLNYVLDDCKPEARKFHFSLCGINLSNLNTGEFGNEQQFANIYNRFFRSMLQYSLKKFFGDGVVVDDIFHEAGQQSDHYYFDWHTISTLDHDEKLNFECDEIKFLPKSHRDDERSNILQLCDVLLGIFKDIHLGVNHDTYPNNKKEILDSVFTKELLVKRVIRNPNNFNSSYGHAKRFQISLFPKRKSETYSILRLQNNYYDIAKINLNYYRNDGQQALFD